MRDCSVAVEPWSEALWGEMLPHALNHFAEVDGGIEPRRPFKIDLTAMQALADAGVLRMVIARKAGELIGYYTWNVFQDVESQGLLIAHQGAWYVAPGHPQAAYDLFQVAIEALRATGVQCVFPHHRTQGRGSRLGKFFRRQGAKDIQRTYSLWIGG